MRPRTKGLLAVGAGALALGAWLPAHGQGAPQSILPPGFDQPSAPTSAPPPPAARPADPLPPEPASAAPRPLPSPEADETVGEADGAAPAEAALDDLASQAPDPVADEARRPIDRVGDPALYGDDAFGDTDGRYLAVLMRRVQAPIASRWMEIVLRRVLMAATPAPAGEEPADWVADRASLLLRLGEANGARRLVSAVDVVDYSPRLRAAAIGSALASADPGALCALPPGPERQGGQPMWPMVRAICATLSGDEATANASIGRAPPGDPIDHALAEKVVAAGGGGRRTVSLEWAAVDSLTDWRFGLAAALGAVIPQALLDAAPAWMSAWLAQAPMLSAADRVAPARVAAALGPLSSADLVDVYARASDEGAGGGSDAPAGRLHVAYRGEDDDARLAALRDLWRAPSSGPEGERDRYAGAVLTARASLGVASGRVRGDDLPVLVGALFAGGFDRQAVRWAAAADAASDEAGDRAWSILAVGAEQPAVPVSARRLAAFAKNAGSEGRHRVAMLAAALAGLGRLPDRDAAAAATAAGFDLARDDAYARALLRASAARAPGTVALLAAVGLQAPRWSGVRPADLYRLLQALRAVGMMPEARMIAAEAMARL